MPERHFDSLFRLYQEQTKVATVFWEWRSKVLSAMLAGFAAVAAATGWMLRFDFWGLAAMPSLLAGGFCLMLRSFEIRTAAIVEQAYKVCGELEGKLLAEIDRSLDNKLLFQWFESNRDPQSSFSGILQRRLSLAAGLFFGIGAGLGVLYMLSRLVPEIESLLRFGSPACRILRQADI